jgi:Predicted RNA-binding protein containing KH domain, possibly ribosomal protein
LREIRHRRAEVRVGKKGITEDLINEIKRRVKKRKFVKISLSKAVLINNTKEGLIRELENRANMDVIEVRGFTVIMRKRS